MSDPAAARYGAIEAGGTKFVCAVGNAHGEIIGEATMPTISPAETLPAVAAFFVDHQARYGAIEAIGIGAFGPVHVRPGAPRYGQIGNTPKPGWAGVDLLGEIRQRTGVPSVIDTDVNCALLGEATRGAGVGFEDLVYVTVGTGIGAGILVGGQTAYGFAHPEAGHMLVPKLADDIDFAGTCPFHGDRCLEGLASGPALRARWQAGAEDLPPDHACWDLQARYLALFCANLVLTTAPRRIVLGGGVMMQAHLFPRIRAEVHTLLNGYIDFAASGVDTGELIVPPGLGARAGIVGALELARRCCVGS